MGDQFVCLYMGPRNECSECGFFNDTGTPFCSHDCAAARADRVAAMDRARQERRDREELFAAECDRLRAAGHTDEEIDLLLAGIPT